MSSQDLMYIMGRIQYLAISSLYTRDQLFFYEIPLQTMIILSMHHHALVIMIDYNNNNNNNNNNISCCCEYNNKSVDYFVQVWDSRIEEFFCNFFQN